MQRLLGPVGIGALMLLGCGGAQTGSAESKTPSPAPATFGEQVALGQTAYGAHCGSCHGDAGQGTDKGPRVVGLEQGALKRFETVADVATFVVKNMPPGGAGSLDTETYLAILAFDLKANGIELDEKLTMEVAATLPVPKK